MNIPFLKMDLKEIGTPSETWEIISSLQTLIFVVIKSQILTFSVFELLQRTETKIFNAISSLSDFIAKSIKPVDHWPFSIT